MSNADRASTRVCNFDYVSRLRVASIGHIARKNPRMPAGDAVGGFSIHTNSGQASNSRMKKKKGRTFASAPKTRPAYFSWRR